MRKVTLALAMLPLLATTPVLAAAGNLIGAVQLDNDAANKARRLNGATIYLAQASDGTQQLCSLIQQNAQSYGRILQLRDRLVQAQRSNETRFKALEARKGMGGGTRTVSIGSTALLDEIIRDNTATSGNHGDYVNQGAAAMAELIRNLTGKVEDVEMQITDTERQLQNAQDDIDFRFKELEKAAGIASPAPQPAPANATAAAPDPCTQGLTNPAAIANILGARVEAMNFQILEFQDQMQKMLEENERRFEALETGKRSDAGDAMPAAGDSGLASAPAADVPAAIDTPAGDLAAAPADNGGTLAQASPGPDGAAPANSGHVLGEPPQTLGSIRFDQHGNVIGDSITATPRPATELAPAGGASGGEQVAALPMPDNPNTLYQAAYKYLMAGDYKAAETGFREHIKRYPADPQTAEARFWLGESLFAQGRYPEAATIFVDTQRDYPDSKRAPENMFKLGLTLEKMDNRDVACATFEQIPQRYPKAAPAVLKRVAEERARIKC